MEITFDPEPAVNTSALENINFPYLQSYDETAISEPVTTQVALRTQVHRLLI